MVSSFKFPCFDSINVILPAFRARKRLSLCGVGPFETPEEPATGAVPVGVVVEPPPMVEAEVFSLWVSVKRGLRVRVGVGVSFL